MLIRGVVTAVELYDGEPYVTIGGSIVPLSQVISVNAVTQTARAESDDDQQGVLGTVIDVAKDLLNPVDEIAALAGAINPLRLL